MERMWMLKQITFLLLYLIGIGVFGAVTVLPTTYQRVKWGVAAYVLVSAIYFGSQGLKVTEARIDALARLEPAYLAYLERHLHGRMVWEREFLKQGGMR